MISKVNQYAKLMDILLLGDSSFIGMLIRYAQKTESKNGKPSQFSHCALWVDEDTIIESTIDFEKYETGRRLDNGVQYNSIESLNKYDVICLVQHKLSDIDRELLLKRANRLYKQNIKYPILGLVGSLLSYWVFRWQSNPLQTKHSLYCSAFVQEVYSAVGYDFSTKHTARNTCPEHIYQFSTVGMRIYNIV